MTDTDQEYNAGYLNYLETGQDNVSQSTIQINQLG